MKDDITWPPADFNQPVESPHVLNLALTPEKVLQAGKRSGKRILYDVIAMAVVITINLYFGFFAGIAVTLLYLFAYQGLIVRKITKMKGTESQIERNNVLHKKLYDGLKSNTLSIALLLRSTARGNVDLYSDNPDDVLKKIKGFIIDNEKIGQRQCQNGHSPLCIHKIPADLAAWLNA